MASVYLQHITMCHHQNEACCCGEKQEENMVMGPAVEQLSFVDICESTQM